MSKTIAIIEDEKDLAENYRDALEREGYQVQVYADRPAAQAAFESHLPDMAIIDIQLADEKEGGLSLCSWLRGKSKTLPIIFLTALDSELDEVLGLKLGADEYLTKGLSLPLLSLRVGMLLKLTEARLNANEQTNVLVRGKLKLDLDCRRATWNGKPLELSYSALGIVECLARHPGQIKSRQQLMDAIDKVIADESVNSYIKRIRKAIREIDPDANPIRSEHSAGYRWVSDE